MLEFKIHKFVNFSFFIFHFKFFTLLNRLYRNLYRSVNPEDSELFNRVNLKCIRPSPLIGKRIPIHYHTMR